MMNLPRAIWMPSFDLPACYQGSPVEMVQEMANEMKPGLSVEEAIDALLENLCETRQVKIHLGGAPSEYRAAGFVAALLCVGIAKPMPSA